MFEESSKPQTRRHIEGSLYTVVNADGVDTITGREEKLTRDEQNTYNSPDRELYLGNMHS